jgi:PAS domain S-box-containing protein
VPEVMTEREGASAAVPTTAVPDDDFDGGVGPFAVAVRATRTAMVITDARRPDQPIVFVNDAFCGMTGYTRAEILGRNCRFLQGTASDPAVVAAIRAALEAGEAVETDIVNYRKNGEAFWNQLLIAPVRDAAGTVTHFISNQVDVTAQRAARVELLDQNAVLMELSDRLSERARELAETNERLREEVEERLRVEVAFTRSLATADQARAALLEREAHLRSVLDTVPEATIVIDENGVMQSFSAAAEHLFGFSATEAIGHDVAMLMPEPYHTQHGSYLGRYLRTGERRVIGRGRVVVGQRRDGTTFPMELSVGEMVAGERRSFVGFIHDLSERQATQRQLEDLQAELIHMSRFTAMGEMASTLAHELNQPLTAVVSYLNGCRRLIDGADTLQNLMIRDGMERAADQAMRAGQIISRLRQFVSRRESQRHHEDLSKLIDDASALALVGIKQTGVKVATVFDSLAAAVLVDKVQIQQVILNLIRNAIEAMQETDRRELTISTEQVDRETVEVRVTDTGPGIAPSIAAQLFQPFVTTKPQGMGVGLSISRTIIESHGGRLWADANPEGGTVFRLTLKTASREAALGER